MTKKTENPGSGTYHLAAAVFLAIFAFALYANTIGNDYNLDDEYVTINHPLTTQGISAIPKIFTSPYFDNQMGNQYEYRPVVSASFAIEHEIFPPDAQVSHTINVLLYLITALVLFFTLRRLWSGYNEWLPFVVTLLFIAHPLHTEAVASIKNRDEILCFLGGILSLNFASRFLTNRKWGFYALFVLFFLFGILSKRSLLSFGLLLPCTLLWFSSISRRDLLTICLPLVIITFFFSPTTSGVYNFLIAFAFIAVPFIVQMLFLDQKYFPAILSALPSLSLPSFRQAVLNIFHGDQSTKATDDKAGLTIRKPFFEAKTDLIPVTVYGILLLAGMASVYFINVPVIITFSSLIALVTLFSGEKLRIPLTLTTLLFLQAAGLALSIPDLSLLLFSGTLLISLFFRKIHPVLIIGLAAFFVVSNFALTRDYLTPVYFLPFLALILVNKRFNRISVVPYIFLLGFIPAAVVMVFINKDVFTVVNLLFPLVIGISILLAAKDSNRRYFIPVLLVALPLLSGIYKYIVYPVHSPNAVQVYRVPVNDAPDTASVAGNIVPAAGRNVDFVENPLPSEYRIGYRTATPFVIVAMYLKLLIFPADLQFYYGYDTVPIVNWADYRAIISFILFACMFGFALLYARKWPIPTFGIFYLVINLLFISNLGVVVAGVIAERLVYIGSLGFAIILGWGILRLLKVDIISPRIALNIPLIAVLLLITGAYTYRVITRNAEWQDKFTLYSSDARETRSAKILQLTGGEYLYRSLTNQGNPMENRQKAEEFFLKAVNIYPEFGNALNNLGYMYAVADNCPKAMPYLKHALELDPFEPEANFHYAGCLDQAGQLDTAAFYYTRALQQNKTVLQFYTNLSYVYFRLGKFQESIEVNKTAIQNIPNATDPYVNIGRTYAQMNDFPNAIQYMESAHKLNPNLTDIWPILAELHTKTGNLSRAQYFQGLMMSYPGGAR